ncbi:Acyltransferase protein [Sodalis praecaptivus]|uniref:Acyltransferase protein n=1 Tax=Sodalis praecaptivus TaxID=1239307 RepID=W0HVS8_9GAMM|nr:acyltransferase [Sodalis praecaptivus]AHF77879.1 Acyltransferase protein [Sodalis praecaptivus]
MRYINELEGLRGIMALWVVVGHSLAGLPLMHPRVPPSLLNIYAVDVFIILSGFVIFFMIDNKKQSYPVFITQRFFRIFPVYIFALIASAILIDFTEESLNVLALSPFTARRLEIINNYQSNPSLHFLFHSLLLQGIIPENFLPDTAYTLLGQAWSVSVEWQFYLIAPVLFMLIRGIYNKYNCLLLCVIASLIIILNGNFAHGFIGKNLSLFSVGFATFFFYKNYSERITAIQLFYLYAAISFISFLFLRKGMIPIFIWATVFYFTILKQKYNNNSLLASFLDSKPVLFLGRISYSIYMVHMILLFFVLRICHEIDMPLSLKYFVVPLLTIVVSIGVSALTHKYIEKPMIKLGKRLTSKQNKATPSNIIPQ